MGKEYEVERIIDKKIKHGKPYYMIKWKGYPSSDNSWEPLRHLEHCDDLVQAFESSSSISLLKR
jgi:hypothetical protein